ncbi:hypothetical protein K458DRAFT_487342 [Lentithecium fluviatile CBS 122367]|uniref:Uncharacterized protein n=1 Tax=Lentithecium fluviatile CBS 122367 TaxID=1168545 RepID=A0A6G1J2M1_9PLEO|nr:hypothetical protein K458DRAFT_487342 [Lentithecium fluviatile CBS 122367]
MRCCSCVQSSPPSALCAVIKNIPPLCCPYDAAHASNGHAGLGAAAAHLVQAGGDQAAVLYQILIFNIGPRPAALARKTKKPRRNAAGRSPERAADSPSGAEQCAAMVKPRGLAAVAYRGARVISDAETKSAGSAPGCTVAQPHCRVEQHQTARDVYELLRYGYSLESGNCAVRGQVALKLPKQANDAPPASLQSSDGGPQRHQPFLRIRSPSSLCLGCKTAKRCFEKPASNLAAAALNRNQLRCRQRNAVVLTGGHPALLRSLSSSDANSKFTSAARHREVGNRPAGDIRVASAPALHRDLVAAGEPPSSRTTPCQVSRLAEWETGVTRAGWHHSLTVLPFS